MDICFTESAVFSASLNFRLGSTASTSCCLWVPERRHRDEDALQSLQLYLESTQIFYYLQFGFLHSKSIGILAKHQYNLPDSLISEIMANMCPYGGFTHAVVRGIPETFGKAVGDSHENGEASVDLAKAQRQFGCLTGALRQKVGLQLIEIPPDPELPESWRIEDVAVMQGSTALITRPFKHQRRSEVSSLHPS